MDTLLHAVASFLLHVLILLVPIIIYGVGYRIFRRLTERAARRRYQAAILARQHSRFIEHY